MTEQTQPTDAEIEAAWTDATGSSILPYPDDMLAFARAVLAKWGTPAGAGDPLFWYRPVCGGDMYEGPFHTNSADAKKLRAYKPDEWKPLFTTPQPTQAQASFKSGAKSFQTYAEANAYSKGYYAGKKAATKAQAGAVPLATYRAYALIDSMGWALDDQEKDDMLRLLRATEAAHGIAAHGVADMKGDGEC